MNTLWLQIFQTTYSDIYVACMQRDCLLYYQNVGGKLNSTSIEFEIIYNGVKMHTYIYVSVVKTIKICQGIRPDRSHIGIEENWNPVTPIIAVYNKNQGRNNKQECTQTLAIPD